jgi:FAD:protein FMN transferase
VSDVYVHSRVLMDTVVSIQVVGFGATPADREERTARVDRAIGWFHAIESSCNRFDESSELSQLSTRIGSAIPVSPLLFEAVRYALAVAAETDGAFDPTIGARMAARGFNREYRSGQRVILGSYDDEPVTFRDVTLDSDEHTITLLRPLLLDLGAVVKGLAMDLAARELQELGNFAIDAGGDLCLGGHNQSGEPWSVGIRHPRMPELLIARLQVTDCAVCTSGDYERKSAGDGDAHHLMDPRTGGSASSAVSATVVASSAMVADALGTAAFVLGPDEGIELLERQGVQGLIVTPSLEHFTTTGFSALTTLAAVSA